MPVDTKEKGLEDLIVKHLTQIGYEQGTSSEYSKEKAIDIDRLFRFIETSQGQKLAQYHILDSESKRQALIERLKNEIEKRGTIAVLRNGIEIYPAGKIELYNYLPSEKTRTQKPSSKKTSSA